MISVQEINPDTAPIPKNFFLGEYEGLGDGIMVLEGMEGVGQGGAAGMEAAILESLMDFPPLEDGSEDLISAANSAEDQFAHQVAGDGLYPLGDLGVGPGGATVGAQISAAIRLGPGSLPARNVLSQIATRMRKLDALAASRSRVIKRAKGQYQAEHGRVVKLDIKVQRLGVAKKHRDRSASEQMRTVTARRAVRWAKLHTVATTLAQNARSQKALLGAIAAGVRNRKAAPVATLVRAFNEISGITRRMKKIRRTQVKAWTKQSRGERFDLLMRRRARVERARAILRMTRLRRGLTVPEETQAKRADRIASVLDVRLGRMRRGLEPKAPTPPRAVYGGQTVGPGAAGRAPATARLQQARAAAAMRRRGFVPTRTAVPMTAEAEVLFEERMARAPMVSTGIEPSIDPFVQSESAHAALGPEAVGEDVARFIDAYPPELPHPRTFMQGLEGLEGNPLGNVIKGIGRSLGKVVRTGCGVIGNPVVQGAATAAVASGAGAAYGGTALAAGAACAAISPRKAPAAPKELAPTALAPTTRRRQAAPAGGIPTWAYYAGGGAALLLVAWLLL